MGNTEPRNLWKIIHKYSDCDQFFIADTLANKTLLLREHFMSTKAVFPEGSKLLATDYEHNGNLRAVLTEHAIPFTEISAQDVEHIKAHKIKTGDMVNDIEMTKMRLNISAIIAMNNCPDYVLRS